MLFKTIPFALYILLGVVTVVTSDVAATTDSAGYFLPTSGTASTSQFVFADLFANGTACGADGYPNGKSGSGDRGHGPGYLYAAINQLAFGANPAVHNGGGPGGACGVCYQLTPRDTSGSEITENALVFKIIDECVMGSKSNGACDACTLTDISSGKHSWHFVIAGDAMDKDQYNQFFNGADGGLNWSSVDFQKTSCGVDNPNPLTKSWGCVSGCSNNDKASVCQAPSTTTTPASTTTKEYRSTVTVTVTAS